MDETMERLKQAFPVLVKLERGIKLCLPTDDECKLELNIAENHYLLTQQDCLELSQLFGILATAFEEE